MDKGYILDNIVVGRVLLSIGVFCGISLFAVTVEKTILPAMILMMKTRGISRISLVLGKKMSLKRDGVDALENASKKYPNKGIRMEMIKDFMYLPAFLIFCLVAYNSIWSYLLIIPILYFTLEYGRKIVSLLTHFNIK